MFKTDGSARCENKKYCKRFDNWHWWSPHQRCYRQFSQGPCRKGNFSVKSFLRNFSWNWFHGNFVLFKIFQENFFTWTTMKVELAVIVNQNGMFIIGIKPKNVLSKNLPVLVHPDNILLIILLHEVQNAIVSRIMCSIQL